jgi:hypothetical protein
MTVYETQRDAGDTWGRACTHPGFDDSAQGLIDQPFWGDQVDERTT